MRHRHNAVDGVEVRIRFLPQECLWSWELFDRRTGALIESGWQKRWLAYGSPEEAYAAGIDRLCSIARRRVA